MKAFICVYRHKKPSNQEWIKTQEASLKNPDIQEFLDGYNQSFFDWGDDPGFFAALKQFKNPCLASWGVCRRDVRKQLCPGDFIIWFCAFQNSKSSVVDYFFIGCTTVSHVIKFEDRAESTVFESYKDFYNTLAICESGSPVQKETFYNYHKDWNKRIQSPYIVFSDDPSLSAVNLTDPNLVARKRDEDTDEQWLPDEFSQRLEKIIFKDLQIKRHLRTTHPQRPHRQIALHKSPLVLVRKDFSILVKTRDSILSLIKKDTIFPLNSSSSSPNFNG
ncbi:hypothetical protein LptCag_1492 [Leptospirillum ferriphilum]|uniref:Nucleotide modification associated domain-containing protein n=2 Tax=Leptospirillum ferriphilum TaxID=178606 RepID=A0A094WDR4_9BACT|nr:hypothetical protein LptCag_1492 [Leptospirillum ferriphilum]